MRKTTLYCTSLTLLLFGVAAYSTPFGSNTKTNSGSSAQGMTYPTPVTPNPTFSADKFKADVDAIGKQNKDALNKQFEKILPKTSNSSTNNTQATPYDPSKESNASSSSATTSSKPSANTPVKDQMTPSANDTNDGLGNNPFSDSSTPSSSASSNQQETYSGFGTKPQNQSNSMSGGNSQGNSGSKSGGWNVQY